MPFTGRPGNPSSQPGNFIPGFGLNVHRYAQSFSASMTPHGTLTSIHNNVFGQVSVAVFRAVSRATSFITSPRPLI